MPQIWCFLQQNNFLEQILNYSPFSKPMLNLKLTLFRSWLTLSITIKGDQAYPQNSINELIIWKISPLVVAATGVKFKSTFLHA